MYICHARKKIFVHIQKTGGTAIRRSVLSRMPEGEQFLRYHNYKHGWLGLLSGIYEDYSAFTVVRNPYQRFVSLFLYTKKGPPGNPLTEAALNGDLYNFMMFLDSQKDEMGNKIIFSQYDFIKHDFIKTEFYKYEDGLQNAADSISDSLGLDRAVLEKNEHTNYYGDYNYLDYLDDKAVKLMNNLLCDTFETFGYEML